jgi:mRNA interferase MazF
MPISRNDIYFVELGPTRGRELDAKRRPVVVVSVDELNDLSQVIVVVPGTSSRSRRRFFNEVLVEPTPDNGLTSPTLFQCHQIKALDPSRFTHERIGILEEVDVLAIEECIRLCLGLEEEL